jgi:pyruvate kinase
MNRDLKSTPGSTDWRELFAEVVTLHRDVEQGAEQRLAPFRARFAAGQPTPSARNLARYLALRQRDRRPLQDRLAVIGLSSLGRCEGHVGATLEQVAQLLAHAVGEHLPADGHTAVPDFGAGERVLAERVRRLFGPGDGQRGTRIMVTLPSEAAHAPELVRSLLEHGMDCARINCAHDDASAWEAMVRHIRHAEAATGRRCKILMDLAGHKLRTGPVAAAPAVRHLRVSRDALGRIVAPAPALLVATGTEVLDEALPRLPIPETVMAALEQGDRLVLTDTSGHLRRLNVGERVDGGWQAYCGKNAYFTPGTPVRWQRRDSSGRWRTLNDVRLDTFAGPPVDIRLFEGDSLLLTRDLTPGEAAGANGSEETPAHIGCTLREVVEVLQPGDPVWLDDGKIGARVESMSDDGALLRIVHAPPKGARLRADKGINLPDTRLPLPPLTAKDRVDLDFACRHADMVGFSFVETLEDMDCLLHELAARDATHLPVIAKIETRRAVHNLPELLLGTLGRASIGVMIARGDLAVEIGGERLAEIQEEILWLCEAAHVPVIWATQVLETLTKKGVISRPELTDAAMAERADCVMLNKGPHVVRAVRTLADILSRMQGHQHKKSARLRALHW